MFGIDLFDAALLPGILVATMAGLFSFISPCVLPIVPPYLAYMGGISVSDMTTGGKSRKAIVPAVFFVLGLSTVFLFLGFSASAFGSFFLQNQLLFSKISGVVVIIFALHFLSIIRIPIMDREMRMDAGDRGGSSFGAYILGLAFAFGWSPCIGPQLGTIMTLAANEASIARGMTLMAFYAAGLGIPFILAAVFIQRSMGLMNWMKRHMEKIERIMGLLLYTVGILLLTGGFAELSRWLIEQFPGLAAVG